METAGKVDIGTPFADEESGVLRAQSQVTQITREGGAKIATWVILLQSPPELFSTVSFLLLSHQHVNLPWRNRESSKQLQLIDRKWLCDIYTWFSTTYDAYVACVHTKSIIFSGLTYRNVWEIIFCQLMQDSPGDGSRFLLESCICHSCQEQQNQQEV